MLTRLLTRPPIAGILIRPVLKIHSRLYKLAGDMAVSLSPSHTHPKHDILRYKEWFLERVEPGWTVVDIGCNTGSLPLLLSGKVARVVGIEISPKLVAIAREQRSRPNITYIQADATQYDLTGVQVDCVTLSNVLEHIEDRIGFLRKCIARLEWRDTMRKRLLIRVPVIERDWISVYKRDMGVDYRLDPTHFTEFTMEQFRAEMDGAGVEILGLERRFDEIYAVCEARPD